MPKVRKNNPPQNLGRGRNTRRRRGRRGGRRSGNTTHIREQMTFSVLSGNSTIVSVKTLSARPANCNFRPVSVSIQAVTFCPGKHDGHPEAEPGFSNPIACQLHFFDPNGTINANTATHLMGPNPRRVSLRYPRSSDWYPSSIVDTQSLCQISAVCIGKASDENVGLLRGVLTLVMAYQVESIPTACPALKHLDGEQGGSKFPDGYLPSNSSTPTGFEHMHLSL